MRAKSPHAAVRRPAPGAGAREEHDYDNDGNLTNDGAATYQWNLRGQLTGLSSAGSSASFAYDALGRRTSRAVNGQTTQYRYDGSCRKCGQRRNIMAADSAATPHGLPLTDHAADRLRSRGIPGSDVDAVVRKGQGVPVPGDKRVHYDEDRDLTVVTREEDDGVVT
jgi:YD repeat-containing protein